jgi:hypothetical protein
VLTELLAVWPDDTSDPLRAVVQQAESTRDALSELNGSARLNLKAGMSHPAIGAEVRDHLSALDRRLAAAQAEQPLTKEWVVNWNKEAQGLIKRLIEQGTPTQPPVMPPPSATVASIAPRAVILEARLNPGDADAISSFLAHARSALAEQGTKPISVVLIRKDDAG